MRPCGPSRTRSMSTAPSAAMPISVRGLGSAPAATHVATMPAGVSEVPPSEPSNAPNDRSRGMPVATLNGSSGSISVRSAAVHANVLRSLRPARRTGTGSMVARVSATHLPVGPLAVVSTLVHKCGTPTSAGRMTISACTSGSASARRSGLVRVASNVGWSVTIRRCALWSPRSASNAVSSVSLTTASEPSGWLRWGSARTQSQ